MTGGEPLDGTPDPARGDMSDLIAALRAAALLLEQANAAYNYDRASGSWSPHSLRHEAAYLADWAARHA